MNTFGRQLRFSVVGESHGPGVGALLDGVPPGLPFDLAAIQARMRQRRPGAALRSLRKEPDEVAALAGVHRGHTTGAPVLLWIQNVDARSKDSSRIPRPGHADAVDEGWSRGHRDHRGGGHRSGRLTAPIVASATLIAPLLGDIRVGAHLDHVAGLAAPAVAEPPHAAALQESMDLALPTCGDGEAMAAAIEAARRKGDSLGGRIAWRADGVPALLGDPWADAFDARIAATLMAIPGVKAVGIGSGVEAAGATGTVHNDTYLMPRTGPVPPTATNRSGGVLGGRTTGMPVWGHVYVKPTSSIAVPQPSYDPDTGDPALSGARGRHDPCIPVRAVPVVRACVELVLADFLLLAAQQGHIAPWVAADSKR